MDRYELKNQIKSIISCEDDKQVRLRLENCILGILEYCAYHERDLLFDYEDFYDSIYVDTLSKADWELKIDLLNRKLEP